MRYDDTNVAERYQAARALPQEVLAAWLAPLRPHLTRSPRLILDLGCGTGRFSEALGTAFEARVVGVDVSVTMLEKAKLACSPDICSFVRAEASRLPVADAAMDLAFLSMVYHHIEPGAVGRELRRVVMAGSIVAIRNSTLEHLSLVPYCDFFPTALEHNRRHLPSNAAIVKCMQSCGFELAASQIIHQKIASSWSEYCEKVAARAYSDLVQVPDEEFARGLAAMRCETRLGHVEEPIDLFLLRAV